MPNFNFVLFSKFNSKVCCKVFTCDRKFLLNQHIRTTGHTDSIRRAHGTRQLQVNDGSTTNSFSNDLCKAFLAADIPLNKLENPVLKSFLEDYCKLKVPSVSSIRNKYVPMSYDDVSSI